MTDARTAFQEILAEVAVLTHPSAVEKTFRFTIEYLTRTTVFFQFMGRCQSSILYLHGQRLDATSGDIKRLPGNLPVASVVDFIDNDVVAFYVGGGTTVSAITREVLDRVGRPPEVLMVEIVEELFDEVSSSEAATRLAFVGLSTSHWSSVIHCPDILATGDLLHPRWCRERRASMLAAAQL